MSIPLRFEREVVAMATGQAATWRRWQDWAALVIGVLVALSPIVVTTSAAAVWSLIVLGVVIALLGVLLFIAPWVLGYSMLGGAAWTSWIGGILAVIVGAAALPSANQEHRLVAQH